MREYTPRQKEMTRRQLELERQFRAQGMSPVDAESEAAITVLREYAPPATAGNGADLDNLDGAAADLVVEDILGGPLSRPSVPQSERVFKDDPTGGLAGVVAAREAAADANWAERGEYYDAKEQEQAELYGPYGDPSAVNNQQQMNRDRVAQGEARVRHNPRQEEARIRRLADRAGIPYAEAEAMVQAGYDREADRMKMPADSRWDVAAPGNPTALPEFSTFSEAHKDLRQLGSDRRAAEKAARQQAVQRTRQAQTNPLEYMNLNDIGDWNRMVAADRMLGRGYRGATPLDVDEATQQALALQESRRAITEGLRPQTPAQTRAADAVAESKRREVTDPRILAREAVERGEFNHPDLIDRAEAIVSRDYSRVTAFGNTSGFLDDEVAEAAQKLTDETGLPLEQSLEIMRRIQQDRMKNFHLSP
jgi:hypothetical protein